MPLQVCVFTAPLFSAFCAFSTYLFIKEIKGQGAGLTSAAFIAIVPSYISRSVAGSYDNEGVAIFALVFVFYLYVKVGLYLGTVNSFALYALSLAKYVLFLKVCCMQASESLEDQSST